MWVLETEPGCSGRTTRTLSSWTLSPSSTLGFWLLFVHLFVFLDRISLCSPACSRTCSVDQVDLELTDLPASISQGLGSNVCDTTTQPHLALNVRTEDMNSGPRACTAGTPQMNHVPRPVDLHIITVSLAICLESNYVKCPNLVPLLYKSPNDASLVTCDCDHACQLLST